MIIMNSKRDFIKTVEVESLMAYRYQMSKQTTPPWLLERKKKKSSI